MDGSKLAGYSVDPHDLTVMDDIKLESIGDLIEGYFLSDSYRTDRHLGWYRNILFYAGKHYVRRVDSWWQSVPRTRYNRNLPRPTVNQIRVEADALTSVLTANAPQVKVDPNSKSFEDKQAAQLAEIVLDTKSYTDGEEELREKLAQWLVQTGNAMRKDYWDPDANEGAGDTRVEVVAPFTMTVNPQASNDQDLEWIMETQPRSFNWIYRHYDREGPGFTGNSRKVTAEASYNEAIQRLLSIRSLGEFHTDSSYGYDDRVFRNHAIVKEWYAKPTLEYPKGRTVHTANGIVLFELDESPYYDEDKNFWHPYTHARYLTIPGNYWGRTPFTDGVDIQRSINTHYALIELNNKKTASPHVMVPYQAGVRKGTFSGKPGTIIRYKFNPQFPGAKPEILEGRGLPNDVFNLLETLKHELSRIMGVHDVLKGDKISGINNYSSLELLREEANKNMSGPIRRFERLIEFGSMRKLVLIQKYMLKDRNNFTLRLQTHNRDITAMMIESFKGADLRGNHSVRVVAQSIAPKSNAAQRAALIEGAQYGIFTFDDPNDRAKAAELLDIPLDTKITVHVKRSDAENDKLRRGEEQPNVYPEDDHPIHITEHNKILLDPNFQHLTADTQKNIRSHIETHMEMHSENMQKQKQGELDDLRQVEMIKAEAKIAASAPKTEVENNRVGVDARRVEMEGLRNEGDHSLRERELDIKAIQEDNKNESTNTNTNT